MVCKRNLLKYYVLIRIIVWVRTSDNIENLKEAIMKLKDCPDVCIVKELAEILNIGINSAYELVKNGSIRSRKIGRIYRVPKVCIIEYLRTTNEG